MADMKPKGWIENGNAVLGVELGSTRIKAVLLGPSHEVLASGSHEWENHLQNGVWTYGLDEVWAGLRDCYQKLAQEVSARYDARLTRLSAIGISAMMHGYLAFDSNGKLLAPFRTWRNTTTAEAAEKLTELFSFNIPQRWSIAHLYQAILNGEKHVSDIAYLTTLAGYVHWKLTGEKVLGIGDASGMFPIDSHTATYDAKMASLFDERIAAPVYGWRLSDILPRVLTAGEDAGRLTDEGAKLLDPTGTLQPGVRFCPPEGDAGTGMTATNSVAPRTGNVSAGTSVFAMIVLEKALQRVHPEIDMVATPSGKPVAMAHCNSCTSDLNAWVSMFAEFAHEIGSHADMNELYALLYQKALQGESDCGGLVAFNYFSGEPVTGLEEGRPLLMRLPDAHFTLANLMRTHLYASLATLKLGMDILLKDENVSIDQIYGHGGLFKTKGVGQRMMAAALNTPVTVMETAGEGGAWGIALLAAFMGWRENSETLESYLQNRVFSSMRGETCQPDAGDVQGFTHYIARYTACLPVERAAVEALQSQNQL